jgi:hypothetical protein
MVETERRQAVLDLQAIGPDISGLSPLLIQQRHDEAFDVEKVTRDFYREIAHWCFWALKHVRFPKDAPKENDGRDHISVIRLITRLIFCWFIREKGLVPDALFEMRRLAEMLDGFAPDDSRNKESVFYRAILQNLVFATLNTEMEQRGWRREEQNFMAHTLYRHKGCFRDPKAALDTIALAACGYRPKCAPDAQAAPLPRGYNGAVMAIQRQFTEEVRHREAERSYTASLPHGQLYVLRELRIVF